MLHERPEFKKVLLTRILRIGYRCSTDLPIFNVIYTCILIDYKFRRQNLHQWYNLFSISGLQPTGYNSFNSVKNCFIKRVFVHFNNFHYVNTIRRRNQRKPGRGSNFLKKRWKKNLKKIWTINLNFKIGSGTKKIQIFSNKFLSLIFKHISTNSVDMWINKA